MLRCASFFAGVGGIDIGFEKNELFICILLIVIYLISNSLCMQEFEIGSIPTVVVNILLTLVICIFIKFFYRSITCLFINTFYKTI